MSKVQSYIYIAVIVLVLLAVAVVLAEKQRMGPDVDRVPIVDLRDKSMDTTKWKTFKHEVYPYEIKYPAEGDISFSALDPTEYPEIIEGRRIDVRPGRDIPGYVSIESDIKTGSVTLNNVADLENYVREVRDKSVKQYKYTDEKVAVEKVIGENWVGYQFSIILADRFTWLYVSHDNKTYLITCDNINKDLAKAILSTLRFL